MNSGLLCYVIYNVKNGPFWWLGMGSHKIMKENSSIIYIAITLNLLFQTHLNMEIWKLTRNNFEITIYIRTQWLNVIIIS